MLLSIALHSVSFLANFDRQINMSHELMTLNFCAKNTVNDLRENSEGKDLSKLLGHYYIL